MSDPVKTSDVEDVLFSIRRLVSDTPEVEAGDHDDVVKTDALFLTSAHRVNDPATEPEQIDLEDMTSGMSHFRDAIGTNDNVEIPAIEEMFADKEEEDAPLRRLHLSEVVKEVSVSDEYLEDTEEVSENENRNWAADPDVETLGDFAMPEDTFGETTSEAEVTEEVDESGASDTDWEDEDVALEFEEALREGNANVEQDADEDEVHEEVAEETREEEAHNEFRDEELDETHDEEHAMSEQEHVESDDEDELVEEEAEVFVAASATDEKSNVVDLSDFDETLVDEDSLRDMVAEIVREELSGELGERITRNVRKLVRREIHRALMARDFD